MPLFRDNSRRTIGLAMAILFGGYHFATNMIPHSLHAFNFMQSFVAVVALASLMVLVMHHHRQEGGLLTQAQEELILICSFGFFWIALLIAFRAYRQQGGAMMGNGVGSSHSNSNRGGDTGGKRPYPCSGDAAYCIVEEWSYY